MTMTEERFCETYLEKLNPQQREAVLAVDGAILLLAVPGSGKTTVLVTRLGYMILCREIPPERILTMTYTKAATIEMAQRFRTLFGGHCQAAVNFSTINSLSNQIIRHYSHWKNRQCSYLLPGHGEIVQILQQVYQAVNGDFPTDSTVNDVRAIAYANAKPAALPVEPGQSLLPEAVVPGTRVTHKTFGVGTVVTAANGTAVIDFGERYGCRTILLKTAIEKGFLYK